MGADRAQAVACYDGAGPRILGRFSKRYGTPIAVNALSGIIASLFMILAFLLTSGSTVEVLQRRARPRDLDDDDLLPRDLPGALPAATQAAGRPPARTGSRGETEVRFSSARSRSAGRRWRRRRCSGPGSASRTRTTRFPSGFEGQRWQYEASQFIPLAFFILLGVLFYVLGAPTRRKRSTFPLGERRRRGRTRSGHDQADRSRARRLAGVRATRCRSPRSSRSATGRGGDDRARARDDARAGRRRRAAPDRRGSARGGGARRPRRPCSTAGIDAELRIVASTYSGGPAHDIAEVAKEVDAGLIVAGVRGLGLIKGLLVGSVAHRLPYVATCPVLDRAAATRRRLVLNRTRFAV